MRGLGCTQGSELYTHKFVEFGDWHSSNVDIKNSKHDVVRARYINLVPPDRLVDSSANSIADHGRFVHLLTHHHRYPVCGTFWILRKSHQAFRPAGYLTVAIGIVETAVPMKTVCSGQHDVRTSLVSQAGATLIATSTKYVAASFARHTLKETVLFGAMSFFGLICPFGHECKLSSV